MTEALKRARAKYAKKRLNKTVSFHLERDKDLIEFARSEDFTNEVKRLIRGSLKDGKSKD